MLSLTCRSLKDYLGSKKRGLVVAKVQEGRREGGVETEVIVQLPKFNRRRN